jgi:flagellar biosynthesis GTPase FlhF
VPLPSVEATTREGAIAAAREKYGSTAKVVAVRKTRSGGVMGFFASERYIAEVEEVPARRPAPLSDSRRRIEAALSRDERFVDDWDDDGYTPPRAVAGRRTGSARGGV